jgi:hypothetical protein
MKEKILERNRGRYIVSPLDYQSLEDLKRKERKGQFLTTAEKKYLQGYAKEQRLKNLSKKK